MTNRRVLPPGPERDRAIVKKIIQVTLREHPEVKLVKRIRVSLRDLAGVRRDGYQGRLALLDLARRKLLEARAA